MNENLFNTLFDREIHNFDYLRGRVACCIKPISDEIAKNPSNCYVRSFYKATMLYNQKLINYFGAEYLNETHNDLIKFKKFLFNLIKSDDIYRELSSKYTDFLSSYYELAKYVGYVKRSRILRRYRNFKKISSNFLKGKISIIDYKKEIENHFSFFSEMTQKFENVDPNDIAIYYFVYDIRAADGVRKLKHQTPKSLIH